nr:stage III sporulation protein AA [uncultured Merdimonas sp.]
MREEQILHVLPRGVRRMLEREGLDYGGLQEIRLRVGMPLILVYRGRETMLRNQRDRPYLVTEAEIGEMMEYVSNYSLYAYEQEMKQGFITIEGGHRVGMAGQVIVEDGRVKNLKYISSVNVRMSHEIPGCADQVFPYVVRDGQLCHTLLVSPPRCGKTTLLRDMIRQISDGNAWIEGKTVGVVDERSEIGGCYRGVAQNHLGKRTDILDGCPKVEGMMMLIRSMGPEVIAVDEIGSPEDVHAIEYAMHCGCRILATVHAGSMEELKHKPLFHQMIRRGSFERYILLGNQEKTGKVEGIYDERGSLLYREERAC